jgi:ureidoacrylate peracid hydrolase
MLEQIAKPDISALLVVDVQNDFCHQDGLFGKLGIDMAAAQRAVSRLEMLIDHARKAGVPVIFVRLEHDEHTNSDVWLDRNDVRRLDACIKETWGAEFYRIAPEADDAVVIKRRYSPFQGTDLEYILNAKARRTLLVAGVATNICVEQTLRDGFMRDYNVVLVEDCAGAYSAEAHASTVSNVRSFLGRVTTSEEIISMWTPSQASITALSGLRK